MKFFLVSEHGDGVGLAWRLHLEGNAVVMYFRDPPARPSLEGMVQQVSSIPEGLSIGPDVVLFDMVGMGKQADDIRRQGFNVVGGSEIADKLELDRNFAAKIMDGMGIQTPASFAFNSFMDAARFAMGHKKRLVLKPNNNRNTAYTFAGESQDEVINYILHLKSRGIDGRVILQEFIDGTEVSTECFYTKGKPIPFPNSTIETKKFLAGNLGPSTGCQTSVVWAYDRKEPRLVQQSLKKIGPYLEKISHTGPLDINGIVRKSSFYGLEFTPRFGYNAIYAWLRLLDEEFGAVLYRMAHGDAAPMRLKYGFGVAVRVTVPPYPFRPEDKALSRRIYSETKGQIIGGLRKTDWEERVVPLDVQFTKAGFVTAGVDGVVCECTGFGQNEFEAEREAMDALGRIRLANKQARTDGFAAASSRIMDLRVMNYEVSPIDIREKEYAIEPTKIPKLIEEKAKASKKTETGIQVEPSKTADMDPFARRIYDPFVG